MFASSTAFKFDSTINKSLSESASPALSTLIVAVSLFLAANLLGAGTIALGYSTWADSFAPEKDERLQLLLRVLKADQPLLTSLYSELLVRQDAVAGLYGALVLAVPCYLIHAIRGGAISSGEALAQTSIEAAILLALATGLLGLVHLGVSSSLQFLLDALSKYEQAIDQQA